MVLLCFVLDLRSLSLPILRDLKQSLLQLANYYAVSRSKINNRSDGTQSSSKPLLDRIGLCYVSRNRISCSDELKIAYNPHGNFNLRDLHHALNNLPIDGFSPESNDYDLKLADVLSEKILYTWEGHDKNIARKVISISSCLAGTLDSVTMKALMDAAEKNVSAEFVFLERTSNHLGDTTGSVNHLVEQIRSLKNCSFQTCVPDPQVLYGLVKRWLRELKDDRDELLQASLVFKTTLVNTMNRISCNLFTSFNLMVDEFHSCQRLSALEEFLPIPDISQLISSVVVEEIKNTVQASLLKVEVRDYNPVQHERGFHKKLNSLVKESLQFGAILPKSKGNSELDWGLSPEDQPSVVAENELPQKYDNTKQTEENETSSSLSEEWERLIVNELGVIMPSPACNPHPKLDQPAVTSPPSQNINRQLDEKTSRILERLEIPRQLKRKTVSPTISSCLSADDCAPPPVKKPLIPYKSTDVGPISSQPLKPSIYGELILNGHKMMWDSVVVSYDQHPYHRRLYAT
ncbi:hypothetical protein PHJA_002338200 [Phtheirospermum japonicum]|uniref:Uncharacterized protein n=1 Tax=Phtheirospermum japonicum TaxID=374723 RepID=A0A830CUQ5_9LAMI|nr:hypothetical protein PHJA_002338200 [Phtheirospermum japonicum]